MTVHVLIPHRAATPARAANLATVSAWWHDLTGRPPVIADDPDPDRFNRGRALNAATDSFRPGVLPTDLLILADGDLIPDRSAVSEAVGTLLLDPETVPYVVPFSRVEYLSAESSALVNAGEVDPHDDGDDRVVLDGTWDRLSTGGINVVTARAFYRVRGFDPRFRGWGFEDAAFDIAARTLLGGHPLHLDAPVRHLWHERPVEQDAGDPGFVSSLALCHRYEAADGDVDAVVALISERVR